jgi:hypothetical protein
MKTPTRKEAEELGRKFGEFAGISNTGLMLFELDPIGIQYMIDAWIDSQTPAVVSKPKEVRAWRKRQIAEEA